MLDNISRKNLIILFVSLVLFVCAPSMFYSAVAQQVPSNAPPSIASQVPSNPPPTAVPALQNESTAQGARLAQSLSDSTRDICGNPLGTTYSEGAPCKQLESQQGPYITYKTPWETSLTVMALILAVAFLLLYCALHVFVRQKIDESAIRYFIIVMVIGSAVFVLTAGYDDKQAAPLYALFGTLVGYLFGKSQGETDKASADKAAADKAAADKAAADKAAADKAAADKAANLSKPGT
ncbi:hypothetical protein [Rhizobium leguminosarum]|uniref:hypothetical protein n=1 Tax=Rhizobium leguminosarum TaxID=384 RepID=UPI001C967213|nr:hypothetical protein [Rhizobium leguminosarum]MBY5643743.1 hypothetical protein [Rhizobium leguminosarum]